MGKFKSIISIIACFVIGPVLMYFGWKEYSESSLLVAQNETVAGKVTDARKTKRKSSWSYYLTVEYKPANGVAISREFRVDEPVYEASIDRKTVDVYYHPPSPAIARAGGKPEKTYRFMIFGLIALGGGIFLAARFKNSSG